MKSFTLFCALAASAMGVPRAQNYQLHERRDFVPKSWIEGKKLDGNVLLPVRIGLTQSNLDYGQELLMDLSNPYSSRYGQHLSTDEVYDLFAPTEKSVNDVRSWLESAGIAKDRITQSINKQWIQFDADAEELESLLHAKYYVYSHAETGRSHVACREYYLPNSVREHVDYITPGISLREVTGVRRSADKQKRSLGGILPILEPILQPIENLLSEVLPLCSQAITPQYIQQMYNISEGHSVTKGNELGIFEGIGDVYAQEDLNLFFSNLYSKIPHGTHPTLKSVDGGKAPVDLFHAGSESDLDFQISYPIIWPQDSILFQTDDMNYENYYTFSGFLNTFLDAIDGSYCSTISHFDPPYLNPADGGYKGSLQCGVYDPPKVISISYGSAEADLPISYRRRQCAEFMKLGTMGVSVVVASGDSGVAGRGGHPTPSGGFSNIYKAPDYQAQAVADYFEKTKLSYPYYESVDNSSFGENNGIYNRIGRGYPDVSAIGDKIVIYNKGKAMLVGGTSASAPVLTGILTRINEERLAAGKSTVGFVNPVLYAHPEAFFDVTKGTNKGCKTDGFPAAEGWDPVTGLGTPNYPELLRVFMGQ
ncbi:Peptidase S8/S53, subtilisin/kexin/sedolisin [Penicillium italicum]|uniref:Peptidase S8/S53, subtilisin/kexin/sedolisin n=1 Tax=Penicillium italicum TaxID=40296 RepID=A0A0A2L454_PENIT|nr:Peptidase S8/S53, subtilisin/kexin/sedolisin [Penicillium italicum]